MTPEELERLLEQPDDYPERTVPRRHISKNWLITGAVAMVALMLVGGFNLVYAGKILPGVRVHGVYLGGLNKAAALAEVQKRTTQFTGTVVPISYQGTINRLDVKNLQVEYKNQKAVEAALAFGRTESLATMVRQQLRSMFGRPTNFASYTYQAENLSPYLNHMAENLATPVSNAGFTFAESTVGITPAKSGGRLDTGLLAGHINNAIAATSEEQIAAPSYQIKPAIEAGDLESLKDEAASYVSGPLELKAASRSFTVNPDQIVTWIGLHRPSTKGFAESGKLEDFYPQAKTVEVDLKAEAIGAYVKTLASRIDQKGQDAALTIEGDRVSVFQPSRDGYELNQPAAIKAIKEGLAKTASERLVTLEVKVVKPTVREDNLNNLGIKELISEGNSFFPGSPPARIQNIRVGTARYQGVLIKPGQVFSFGEILGEVSAATGYAPAKVILADRQEEQYGGGLCQVSSTIYRAALNAGLPITQRINHSFAINYYTYPYGVPGVDATIYYPQVDLKFRNDTGAHILIQAQVTNSTLKFQFYGTKTKEGKIRGPFFISGDMDATKPSRTVFYRDVIVNGQVTKTDTVYTNYKSSKDFPAQQYN